LIFVLQWLVNARTTSVNQLSYTDDWNLTTGEGVAPLYAKQHDLDRFPWCNKLLIIGMNAVINDPGFTLGDDSH